MDLALVSPGWFTCVQILSIICQSIVYNICDAILEVETFPANKKLEKVKLKKKALPYFFHTVTQIQDQEGISLLNLSRLNNESENLIRKRLYLFCE